MKKIYMNSLEKLNQAKVETPLTWLGLVILLVIVLFGNLAAEANVPDLLRIKLLKDVNNSDEIVVYFGNGGRKNYYNQEDALKFFGSTVSISSRSKDNLFLAINKYPALVKKDTIRLSLGTTPIGAYSLIFNDLANFVSTTNIILFDKFTQTPIDVRLNNTFAFNITSDPNSGGDNRFEMRFAVLQPAPTATIMRSFTGISFAGTIKVNWVTDVEFQVAQFILQDSSRYVGYENLGSVAGSGTTPDGNTYLFLDNKRKAGAKRYRLKIVDINGNFTYSNVIVIKNSNGTGFDVTNPIIVSGPGKTPDSTGNRTSGIRPSEDFEMRLSVYPNPMADQFNIDLQSNESLPISIEVFNTLGDKVLVKSSEITFERSTHSEDISQLPAGMYFVSIRNAGEELSRTKFIKR